jgi:hypothetical protein
MGLGFLTPTAALIGLAGLIPVSLALLNNRRSDRLRALLGLGGTGTARRLEVPVAIAAVCGLLAFAAAQPVVRSDHRRLARRDAQVFVAIDVSRSMSAAESRTSPTRLERAKRATEALQARLDDVPMGLATFTDRSLPLLFPTVDSAAFDSTVEKAVAIDQPPPRGTAPTVTSFDTVAEIPSGGYFAPRIRRRALVVVTDAESVGLYVDGVRRSFSARPRTAVVVVRVGSPNERVYGIDGLPESAYAPPPEADRALTDFLGATHGRSFADGDVRGAAEAVRAALGSGPRARLGSIPDRTELAPYVVLAAVLPLGLVLRRRNL